MDDYKILAAMKECLKGVYDAAGDTVSLVAEDPLLENGHAPEREDHQRPRSGGRGSRGGRRQGEGRGGRGRGGSRMNQSRSQSTRTNYQKPRQKQSAPECEELDF